MEYVEYSYMREIADKEFPGWSWKVVNTEVLGSEAYVVHGRLKFYDEGFVFVFAHPINSWLIY